MPGYKGRYASYFFSINGKGYIGGGETSTGAYENDLWEFDPATGIWSQKADFGGGNIYGPAVFVINNTPYVCTGTNINNQFKNFVWAYDAQNNSWTQKNNFPGTSRYGAYAFSLGTKGYIGMGQNAGSLNDFWEYEPTTDSWTQRTNFASGSRYGAIAFSINGKGYAGFGSSQGNTINYNDFYEYEPTTFSWTQKASFPGLPRNNPARFVINGIAYVGAGNPEVNYNPNPNYSSDFYAYAPLSNQWTSIATFPGSQRTCAASFSINNKGYVGTGLSGSPQFLYLGDFWEYTPSSTSINENINNAIGDVRIDQTNKYVCLSVKDNYLPVNFIIYDLTGRIVTNVNVTNASQNIKINNLSKGTYIYSINNKDKYIKSDKFIIF